MFQPRIVYEKNFYFPTLTVRKLAMTSQALRTQYNQPDPQVISPHLYTINTSQRRPNKIWTIPQNLFFINNKHCSSSNYQIRL